MYFYKFEVILFLLCVYICNSGHTESIWVGPVWGLDDRRGSYRYKGTKATRSFQPEWIPGIDSGHDGKIIRALEDGSKLTKYYCTIEKNMKCVMGGKGPTIVQKLSTKVAICVCYCPSGYKEDIGCVE